MNTKKLLLATAVILFSVIAHAQHAALNAQQFQRDFVNAEVGNIYAPFINGEKSAISFNEEKYQKFKKMRTGGIVLTFVGAGLIATGTALIASAEDERDYDYYSDDNGEGKAIAGVLCVAFGTLSTGGGITMWVIGNNKMKKYGRGQVSVQSNKNGIGLAYRF
ncbi:MAG: hypothetical protein QM727_14835 [Niabella sp.]